MMRTTYDPDSDAFYARFAPDGTQIATTQEAAPGVNLDLDAAGNLVGVEVLGVRVRGTGMYGMTPAEAAA